MRRREYVITRPTRHCPWINYLGSEAYFGIISNTAGGYSFYRDARLRRLTRYRYNNAPLDLGGRYVYLRDDESGEFWSPSWQPTQRDSRTTAAATAWATRSSALATTASGRDAVLRAARREPRDLARSGSPTSARRRRRCRSSTRSSSASGKPGTTPPTSSATTPSARSRSRTASSTTRPSTGSGATTSPSSPAPSRSPASTRSATPSSARTGAGIGRSPSSRARRPIRSPTAGSRWAHTTSSSSSLPAKRRKSSSSSATRRTQGRQVRSARLADDQQEAGQADHRPLPAARRRREGLHGAARLLDGAARHPAGLDRQRARGPDGQHLERLPVHGDVQHVALGLVLRVGHRPRDGLPRLEPGPARLRPHGPERARERILDIAATQLPTGGAYHQYQPLTKRGNDDVGSGFNDDPAWLVLGVAAYLKETGDVAILDEPVPVRQQAGHRVAALRAPPALDSVHPRPARTARPAADRSGRLERLPEPQLLLETPGESFQTTENKERRRRRVRLHRRPVRAGGRRDGADRRTPRHGDEAEVKLPMPPESMTKVVETAGWDGDWFRRAYDYFGEVVGSAKSAPKARSSSSRRASASWPASASTTARRKRRWLGRASGWPRRTASFSTTPPSPTTTWNWARSPPTREGYKENAGIFCHTNPWIMIAEAMVGQRRWGPRLLHAHQPLGSRGDLRDPPLRAVRLRPDDRRQGCPDSRRGQELVALGTAAWNFVAISQWILGIRAEHDGLRIDPVCRRTGAASGHPSFRGAPTTDRRPQVRRAPSVASLG
jgi:hypothetical protein